MLRTLTYKAKQGEATMLKCLSIVLATLLTVGPLHANQTALTVETMETHRLASGQYAIVGMAENRSNKVIKTAFITFKLYDDVDNLIGSISAIGSNIAPGEKWKFETNSSPAFAKAKTPEISIYDN